MAAIEALNDLDFTKPANLAATAAAHAASSSGALSGKGSAGTGNSIRYVRRRAVRMPRAQNAPVLVVEDDEDTRRLLQRILEKQGLAVRAAAESGAFQAALRQSPLPCLILLDVELPGISGFKLLTALRRHPQTRDIPVVLVTARTESKDLLCGLSLGADGYLSKPFTVAALRTMVEEVLGVPA
jgi:two-component system phosphate regulon response regulator PhoB